MSYIDSILEPGERIAYRTTLTWTLFAPAIAVAVCGLIVLYFSLNRTGSSGVGLALAALLLLAALGLFVPAWFKRWTTEIAVTDRRIILKRGFIRRHTIEMNMEKVESVDVDQSLVGRLFDFGNVSIRGTGSSFERIRNIDAPLKLRASVVAK